MINKEKILAGMALRLHETCLEYFRRRLSEGWKCISLEGYNAVLLSPECVRRKLNLRNDIETLRPNAAGSETNIPSQYPDSTFHWDKVDEAETDEAGTYVYNNSAWAWRRDLYAFPASSGSGTINKVTLYFRVRLEPGSEELGRAKGAIKTNDTVYETNEKGPVAWRTYYEEWAQNPSNAHAWTWDEIDALEAGISLYPDSVGYATQCTQVYVEVDFEVPPGWTGEIAGVTNPASIMGVDVADIETVKGVVSG